MNCERTRDQLPELLDARTPATALPEARAHLAGCADCQREFAALSATARALDAMPAPAPSPRLRTNFYATLEQEKNPATAAEPARGGIPARHTSPRWWWLVSPAIAGACLLIGFTAGKRSTGTSAATTRADDAHQRELIALRTQMDEQLARQTAQLEKMTTLVGYSILQQQQNPANERLQEVLIAAREPQPKPKVIDDLIKVLTLDPSANVRLRAIEALYPHAERAVVRAGVLAALPREQNPLVQLELIDFVATAQDRDAAPVLESIVADESANDSVRDAAKRALAQL
jgi:hypothetical protein